jgi:hypothetical protein
VAVPAALHGPAGLGPTAARKHLRMEEPFAVMTTGQCRAMASGFVWLIVLQRMPSRIIADGYRSVV